MPNHYETLGVAVQADHAAIRKAYHKRALENHPDKTSHLPPSDRAARENGFKAANNAWEVLSDTQKRAAYDRTLPTLNSVSGQHLDPFSFGKRHTPRRASQPAPPRQTSRQQPPPYQTPGWQPPQQADSTSSRQAPPPSDDPASRSNSNASEHPQNFSRVSESSDETRVSYSDSMGWSFTIAISKKFRPRDTPMFTASATSIDMVISLERTKQQFNPGTKEVCVEVDKTPLYRSVTLASLFEEDATGIVLKISLAYALSFNTSPRMCSWVFAFDANHGYMAPNNATFRATCLIFHNSCPDHAFWGGLGQRSGVGYPPGSPMAVIAADYPSIAFVALSNNHYCMKMYWGERMFYQLAAIGYLV